MKRCTKCGDDKKEHEFCASAANVDGLQAWCRSCKRACPPSPPVPHVPGFEKRCSKCGRFKCGLDFSWKKAGDMSYGLQAWCKDCMGAAKKFLRQQKNHHFITFDREQRERVKQAKFEALKKLPPTT